MQRLQLDPEEKITRKEYLRRKRKQANGRSIGISACGTENIPKTSPGTCNAICKRNSATYEQMFSESDRTCFF